VREMEVLAEQFIAAVPTTELDINIKRIEKLMEVCRLEAQIGITPCVGLDWDTTALDFYHRRLAFAHKVYTEAGFSRMQFYDRWAHQQEAVWY